MITWFRKNRVHSLFKMASGGYSVGMVIRVVLADDHDAVRSEIRSIIERLGKDMEVIGEADNGLQLVDISRQLTADVYVVDINMPGMNGIEAGAQLLRMHPGSKVVILTVYDDRALINRAFRQGMHGYVLKECSPQDIVRAIREVHRGRYFISPELSGYVVNKLIDGDEII
jgi:two-component system NarL family response regulator